MTDNEFVAIRTYLNQFETEVARTALDAAGIEALIRVDDCGGMRPALWMGGVRLFVAAVDAARAEEILSMAIESEAEDT